MADAAPTLESLALAPLERTRAGYRLLVVGLLAVAGAGFYAYGQQLSRGLAVTGMASTDNKVMWGLYITNFVFFIGISHAGTLISAILRVSRAGWRTPVTRMAEFITVVALSVGALFPIVDLGRPDRLVYVIRYGRWQSPILWDLFAITTYMVGSLLYLYLPLIPDLATCRDRLINASRVRRWFYRTFSLGWTGEVEQKRNLAAGLGLMMVVIIMVAVSVHTVVSWIFAMTLRTGWNTAVFGIYFVAGAIFSGIAALILVMAVLRKACHLEDYITHRHFQYLGYLMAALALVMIYFNVSEMVTSGYKLEANEPVYLGQIFTGSFAPLYWFYVFAGLVLPCLVMLTRRLRQRTGAIVTAALFVVTAMWFERYIIVVASLRVPQMPYTNLARYLPTGVELAITGGAFALFALLIAVAVKLFPVVSIWEIREAGGAAEPVPGSVAGQPTSFPVISGGAVDVDPLDRPESHAGDAPRCPFHRSRPGGEQR